MIDVASCSHRMRSCPLSREIFAGRLQSVNEVTFVRRRIIFETYVGLPFPSIIQRRAQKLDVHRQAGLVNRSVALRLINRLIDRLDDAALGAFDTSSVDGCFHTTLAPIVRVFRTPMGPGGFLDLDMASALSKRRSRIEILLPRHPALSEG